MSHCCDKFEEIALIDPPVIERDDEDGAWAVNGCCGGHCFVLWDITHCPFCGTRLSPCNCQERNCLDCFEVKK